MKMRKAMIQMISSKNIKYTVI